MSHMGGCTRAAFVNTTRRIAVSITTIGCVAWLVACGGGGGSSQPAAMTASQVSTLAGSDTSGTHDDTGTAAQFNHPNFMAQDASGNLYISDKENTTPVQGIVRKVTPSGVVTTIVSLTDVSDTQPFFPVGLAVDSVAGYLYIADGNNNKILKVALATPHAVSTVAGTGVAGSHDDVAASATFNQPTGLALDASRTALYVADYGNAVIRKIDLSSMQDSLFAGTVDTSLSVSPVDGPALGHAKIDHPLSLVVTPSNDVIVNQDSIHPSVRKISGGQVTTLVPQGTFLDPRCLAADSLGNFYLSDGTAETISKITATGTVTTIAGLNGIASSRDGLLSQATFYLPAGLVVSVSDPKVFYVADFLGHRIRKIQFD